MTSPEWKSLVEAAMAARDAPIKAISYGGKKWTTGSKPVLLRCSDGTDYAVKGKQVGKALVAEQIVGALGRLIEAPVPKMPLVEVSAELVDSEAALKQLVPGLTFEPGVAHGTLYFSDGIQQSWVQHADAPQNKERFARLAVLYGWVGPQDRQLHYQLTKVPLVWSWDHGGFNVSGGSGVPYPDMMRDAHLKKEDLAAIKPVLQAIQPDSIAKAVACPHETWGLTLEERIAHAQHLEAKRIQLIAALP